MKRLFVLSVLCLSFLIPGVTRVAAQDSEAPELTLDKRIEAAEKENAKLKKLKAILEENKRIKAELVIESRESVTLVEENPTAPMENSDSTEMPAAPVNSISGSGSSKIVPVVADVPPPNTITQPVTKTNGNPTRSALSSPAPKSTGTITGAIRPNTSSSQANPSNVDCDKFEPQKNLCILAQQMVNDVEGRELRPGEPLQIKYRKQNSVNFAEALADVVVEKEQVTKEATLDTQAARTDKQIGSDVQGSGTTSLVAKGGIPLIMSLATENGSAVSSVNGTTMSFRFNPLGLLEYLSAGGTDNFDTTKPLDNFDPTKNISSLLRRTSLGLSYDISQGVDTPTFTGSRDQFSGLSFRYELISQRSPTSNKARDLTAEFVKEAGFTFTATAIKDLKTILSLDDESKLSPEMKTFIFMINSAIEEKSSELSNKDKTAEDRTLLLFQILKDQFAKAPVEELRENDAIVDALKSFSTALDSYQREEDKLQRKLTKGTLMTFDYNFNRSFTASDTSNIRLIYEKGWKNGTDLTFNGSLAAFHDPSPSVPITAAMAQQMDDQSRIRDFGFATQLDVPLNGIPGGFSNSNLSLAFKYQRMNTDSITLFDGTTISGLKGDIYVGQAKVLVPIGKSGLFFPLSFTYANRKELIKEKKSGGNFGFTFDLSSLLQNSFNPFR